MSLTEVFQGFAPGVPIALFAFLAAFIVIMLVVFPIGGICTYIERKLAGDFQERLGPNRVGPLGIFQFLADGIKMALKEDTVPAGADRFVFNLAPSLVVAGSMGAFAAIPFAKYAMGADLDIGIFYIMALGALVSLGVLLGAWSSDNKWSLLGGMRGAAQIISYEIPLGIAILTVVTVSGSLNMLKIVEVQAWGEGGHFWNVLHNPFIALNFIIYFVASLAECNRVPFDLPEAESELVSGFNTEFSGMRFGLYAIGEFADILLFAAVASVIFFGGWQLPFVRLEDIQLNMIIGGVNFDPLVQSLLMLGVFVAKASVFVFIVMWIRWTLPRLRMDQLMNLCWKYMIPIGFFNLMGAAVWMWAFNGRSMLQLLAEWMGFV